MLNLVAALPEEARPVIHHYQLKRLHQAHAFPVYSNGDIRLIVSGIGGLAAASAVGYLAGILDAGKTTAWLNVGIAGCKRLPVGEAALAHKITDMTSQKIFYPSTCFDPPCNTTGIKTVAIPEIHYPDDEAYDMEAAGFYSAALRFSTLELIHSIKIISDNAASHIESISGSGVMSLIERNIKTISSMANILLDMAAGLDAERNGAEEMKLICARIHFTVSQQAQLATLMQNWYALTDTSPLALLNIDALKTAKALLNELQSRISGLPVKY
ncbi:MAG: hypothetical protein L0Z73_16715 [Gammaproteobacteria bacterium]|nr:hypothetical protein [Gammaproteobacteria bacterium]